MDWKVGVKLRKGSDNSRASTLTNLLRHCFRPSNAMSRTSSSRNASHLSNQKSWVTKAEVVDDSTTYFAEKIHSSFLHTILIFAVTFASYTVLTVTVLMLLIFICQTRQYHSTTLHKHRANFFSLITFANYPLCF